MSLIFLRQIYTFRFFSSLFLYASARFIHRRQLLVDLNNLGES